MTVPIKEQLEAHGLLANKSFGQHFLLDLNITRKIVRLAGNLDGATVIEVGPGPGGLTRAILETNAAQLFAIEKDTRFIPLLSELGDPRLTLIAGDALKTHIPLPDDTPVHIIANLPYNVGTELLIGWLHQIERYAQLTLMFQLEVAQRITAPVGHNHYGRLAILTSAVANATLAMKLPARAFTPPPRVDSAVVTITPKAEQPDPKLLKALERVTAAAFGQRRKMLRQSLKVLSGADLCDRAGIDPSLRGEVLTLEQFLTLAALIA
jgi:16S rRNA (adenine1518-N6/adenine1519-N6)-dimethyltransferase